MSLHKHFIAILTITISLIVFALVQYSALQAASPKDWLSTSGRIALWQTTWQIFVQYPLGVGLDQFIYKSAAFTKDFAVLFKDPHNFVLKILVEDGVLYFISLMALLISIIWQLRIELCLRPLAVLFIIFYLVQLLVQFPLDNAFPFMVLAIALGYGANKCYIKTKISRRYFRVLSYTCLTVISLWTFNYSFAKYMTLNARSFNQLALACKIAPYEWEVCIRAIDNCNSQQQLSLLYQQIIHNNPNIWLLI